MQAVTIMSWRTSQGRADSFVLALAGYASERSLRLADVVVHPNQPTVGAATRLAGHTLRLLTGCTVVAVGVDGDQWVVACRAARSVYVLVLSRSRKAATSSAFGSPPSE